jgi:hypothetical protein
VRSVAIFSSTSRPAASMPSSLVIRMRILRVVSGALPYLLGL